MDAVAAWGALTGTVAVVIAARRELIQGRRRLTVRSGVNLNVSRGEPTGVEAGAVTHVWIFVAVWNTGGRPLSIERIGLRFVTAVEQDGVVHVAEHDGGIHLDRPLTASVDGATHKVYTPLGPLLAAGLDPLIPVVPYVVTTGERMWLGEPSALFQGVPPGTTAEQLAAGLAKLRDDAETPPVHDQLVWLNQEAPYLPSA